MSDIENFMTSLRTSISIGTHSESSTAHSITDFLNGVKQVKDPVGRAKYFAAGPCETLESFPVLVAFPKEHLEAVKTTAISGNSLFLDLMSAKPTPFFFFCLTQIQVLTCQVLSLQTQINAERQMISMLRQQFIATESQSYTRAVEFVVAHVKKDLSETIRNEIARELKIAQEEKTKKEPEKRPKRTRIRAKRIIKSINTNTLNFFSKNLDDHLEDFKSSFWDCSVSQLNLIKFNKIIKKMSSNPKFQKFENTLNLSTEQTGTFLPLRQVYSNLVADKSFPPGELIDLVTSVCSTCHKPGHTNHYHDKVTNFGKEKFEQESTIQQEGKEENGSIEASSISSLDGKIFDKLSQELEITMNEESNNLKKSHGLNLEDTNKSSGHGELTKYSHQTSGYPENSQYIGTNEDATTEIEKLSKFIHELPPHEFMEAVENIKKNK